MRCLSTPVPGIRSSPNVVRSSNAPLENAAVNHWLMRYANQPFSMVDAVSFAIMAERGTRAALTLDRHFAIAGFQMVTDQSTPTGAA